MERNHVSGYTEKKTNQSGENTNINTPLSIQECKRMINREFNQDKLLPEKLETILWSLGEKEQLISILKEIIHSESLISTCIEKSEEHRLGFDKIVLFSDSEYQLRLHIWWPKEGLAIKEGIHNHKFNFGSKIIKGQLYNEMFEKANEGEKVYEYECVPLEKHEFDSFSFKGITTIKKVESIVQNCGLLYTLMHNVFHSAYPLNSITLTATLFLKTKDVKISDTVFEKKPFEKEAIVPNKCLSKKEYVEKVELFISKMRED